MKSKPTYTRAEADEIIKLIKEKLKSDTPTQKGIRAKIRKRGFWASEFGFGNGYTVANFLSVAKISSATIPNSPPVQEASSLKKTKGLNVKTSIRKSDEGYVIDLCDEVLGLKALRQHRFDFLRGDAGTMLPVDAYYPTLKLVIEYMELQHTEAVKFFDRRKTVSGIDRGEQRKKYDQLRRDLIPKNGMELIELGYDNFEHTKAKRLTRNIGRDIEAINRILIINQLIFKTSGIEKL